VASPHFNLEDFYRVLMAQPWLEEQAVKDVRLEEEKMSLGG
jgi:hypothetical protein